MEGLKSYIIGEFKDKAKGYVATEFKFTHSTNIKIDKKKPKGLSPEGRSNIPIKSDIIKVNIKFVDKDMNVLHSAIVTFENNIITKANAKKLINISPKELENKFMVARKDICSIIMNEYCDKLGDLNSKIDGLKNYVGVDGVISREFKGESIQIVDDVEKPKLKVQYDM